MAMKDLLVHLDSSDRTAERLGLAVALANRFGARLTGVFAESASIGSSAVGRRSPQNMSKAVEKGRALFETATREAGLATDWWQIEPGEYADVVGWTVVCCRYVDLAVLGQHDPGRQDAPLPADLVEQVVLESGRPALVVPYVGQCRGAGRRVLVAWTGSRESARALNDALPLLAAAEHVTILSLQQPPRSGTSLPTPSPDVVRHLAAHGVKASYRAVFLDDMAVVDTVLNQAAEDAADLIVVGAHGQSIFPHLRRSTTTRDLLGTMTVPLLMAG